MKKSLLIFVLTVCTLSLFSCASSDSGKKEERVPGISEYTIVYPDCMGTYVENLTEEKYSALRLQELIYESCGVRIEAVSDAGEGSEKEILIGNARSGENNAEENSYSVTKEGDDIRISAKGIYAYTAAFDSVIGTLSEEGFDIPEKLELSGKDVFTEDTDKDFVYLDSSEESTPPAETAIKKLSIMGTDISEYKIIYHVWGDFRNPHYGLNEAYAAEQLQKYIRYATGIELPIETDEAAPTDYEIVVGITEREGDVIEAIDRSGYGEEAVLIKTEGTRLIITGAERRGTIYAAYTFLEEYLGIRFFTSDCEVVYKSEGIDIPADLFLEHTSSLEYRDVCHKTMHENEYSSKRKVNSNYRRVMNYKQGGNFSFAGEFVHTMGTTLDLDNAPGAAQPCFTDEETYAKAIDRVKTILYQNPDAKIISVTQNDAYLNCGCSSCSNINKKEESTSGALIYFINRLADDIKDEYPDVKIMTLAYMFSMDPPKTAPRDNVVIMFCPIDSCCACALNDPSCPKNASFAKQLEGWLDLTENVYVWYYIVEFTQDGMLPFMNFDAVYENYQYFNELGIKGVFNEGWMNSYGGEFGALRSYLISLLMWDSDMTREEYYTCVNEFIDAYYGEASDIIREYFQVFAQTSDGRHFTQYSSVEAIYRTSELSTLCDQLDTWLKELESLEYSNEEFLNRIRLLSRGYSTLRKSLRY